MVNQLLTSLESHREERRRLVMAATTGIERLEPAVLRPGRFDWHIRIDLPDAAARRSIFEAELNARPAVEEIDFDELVRRTEGMPRPPSPRWSTPRRSRCSARRPPPGAASRSTSPTCCRRSSATAARTAPRWSAGRGIRSSSRPTPRRSSSASRPSSRTPRRRGAHRDGARAPRSRAGDPLRLRAGDRTAALERAGQPWHPGRSGLIPSVRPALDPASPRSAPAATCREACARCALAPGDPRAQASRTGCRTSEAR